MRRKILFVFVSLMILGSVATAVESVELKGYEMYYGEIKEILEDEYSQVLVENNTGEDTSFKELYLYTDSVSIIDLKTGDLIADHKFTKGEMIQYFYRKDTPVMQSLPGKLTPDFIGVNVDDSEFSVDVDHFDIEGHGISHRLEINIGENTKIVNMKGEAVKDPLDKDLVVFYKTGTRSLPPITTPEKIVIIKNIEDNIIDLMDYKGENHSGFYLRKYYESLGAEVDWDRETKITTISLGDDHITIDNTKKTLNIEDETIVLKDFTIIDGVSYISEEYIGIIDEFLIK